jgi:hypothetical protein
MSRRTALALAGWLVAAVAATLTGLAAVRVIGAGLTGPAGGLVSEADVARAVASGTPTMVAPSSPLPTVTPAGIPAATPSATPGTSKVLSSPGGTVVARCDGAKVVLVSWAPAQGYGGRADQESDDHARVRFEGSAGRVEVEVRCAAGQPTATSKRDH